MMLSPTDSLTPFSGCSWTTPTKRMPVSFPEVQPRDDRRPEPAADLGGGISGAVVVDHDLVHVGPDGLEAADQHPLGVVGDEHGRETQPGAPEVQPALGVYLT